MNNVVYVVCCPDYDRAEEKVQELVALMGGMAAYVPPGERAALKVNLLSASAPEQAVTTHPAVAGAVGQLVNEAGAEPFLIDSPSGAYVHSRSSLEKVYRAAEMDSAASEAGLALNYDTDYQAVSFPDGQLIKHFELMTPLLQAGVIINLPKLKTHALMSMTGGVKNLFGAIPGRIKPGYHAKLTEKGLFARMLLDLMDCLGPRLTIMDAVVGMEGDGPGNGDPRPVGLLLGAENPVALDVVAGEIMGLDRADNPLLVEAAATGRGPTRLEEVELVGIDPEKLRIPDFRLPSTHVPGTELTSGSWWQNLISPLFKSSLTLRPEVVPEDCVACEDCLRICPQEVITLADDREHPYAWIDDEGCIRCYCCHETCPQDAIELKKSLLYRLVMG